MIMFPSCSQLTWCSFRFRLGTEQCKIRSSRTRVLNFQADGLLLRLLSHRPDLPFSVSRSSPCFRPSRYDR